MIFMPNNLVDTIDKLQNTIIDDGSKKKSKPKYHFDKLKMYFGEDFNYKGIAISMPTIGDILEIGEENFYQALLPFIYNSTSIRVMLWENGIDWNKIKDIEVFSILSKIIKDKEAQKLIFKNFSFDNFTLMTAKENSEEEFSQLVLYDEHSDILLYEYDFMTIAEYIREMLDMHPKVEKAKGKTAKSWIIQEEKMNKQNKEEKNTSTLLPLISSCVNHPGFKYKLQELREVGIYQFMDSVKRIQKYENGTAALKGCYSGFVDGSKIDREILNYMGNI